MLRRDGIFPFQSAGFRDYTPSRTLIQPGPKLQGISLPARLSLYQNSRNNPPTNNSRKPSKSPAPNQTQHGTGHDSTSRRGSKSVAPAQVENRATNSTSRRASSLGKNETQNGGIDDSTPIRVTKTSAPTQVQHGDSRSQQSSVTSRGPQAVRVPDEKPRWNNSRPRSVPADPVPYTKKSVSPGPHTSRGKKAHSADPGKIRRVSTPSSSNDRVHANQRNTTPVPKKPMEAPTFSRLLAAEQKQYEESQRKRDHRRREWQNSPQGPPEQVSPLNGKTVYVGANFGMNPSALQPIKAEPERLRDIKPEQAVWKFIYNPYVSPIPRESSQSSSTFPKPRDDLPETDSLAKFSTVNEIENRTPHRTPMLAFRDIQSPKIPAPWENPTNIHPINIGRTFVPNCIGIPIGAGVQPFYKQPVHQVGRHALQNYETQPVNVSGRPNDTPAAQAKRSCPPNFEDLMESTIQHAPFQFETRRFAFSQPGPRYGEVGEPWNNSQFQSGSGSGHVSAKRVEESSSSSSLFRSRQPLQQDISTQLVLPPQDPIKARLNQVSEKLSQLSDEPIKAQLEKVRSQRSDEPARENQIPIPPRFLAKDTYLLHLKNKQNKN